MKVVNLYIDSITEMIQADKYQSSSSIPQNSEKTHYEVKKNE